MLKSKWFRFIFILAVAFAISVGHSTTLQNSPKNYPGNGQSYTELPAYVRFSNCNFIAGTQADFSSQVNSDGEVGEIDEVDDDCLLAVPCSFLEVLPTLKLPYLTGRTSGSPSSHLIGNHSLCAPPCSLA